MSDDDVTPKRQARSNFGKLLGQVSAVAFLAGFAWVVAFANDFTELLDRMRSWGDPPLGRTAPSEFASSSELTRLPKVAPSEPTSGPSHAPVDPQTHSELPASDDSEPSDAAPRPFDFSAHQLVEDSWYIPSEIAGDDLPKEFSCSKDRWLSDSGALDAMGGSVQATVSALTANVITIDQIDVDVDKRDVGRGTAIFCLFGDALPLRSLDFSLRRPDEVVYDPRLDESGQSAEAFALSLNAGQAESILLTGWSGNIGQYRYARNSGDSAVLYTWSATMKLRADGIEYEERTPVVRSVIVPSDTPAYVWNGERWRSYQTAIEAKAEW